jgi:hypothetical protein
MLGGMTVRLILTGLLLLVVLWVMVWLLLTTLS